MPYDRPRRPWLGRDGCLIHLPSGPAAGAAWGAAHTSPCVWVREVQYPRLPKGYGPTFEDRLLGVFFDTDGRWSHGKELPPLVLAVKKAVEDHLRAHPDDVAGHLESKDWSDGSSTIDGKATEIVGVLPKPMGGDLSDDQ